MLIGGCTVHSSTYNKVKEYVGVFLDATKTLNILDVGSCDINGTYKPIFDNPNWVYKGIDIVEGKNVDQVVVPYAWDIADELYDVIVYGQCLEHDEMPWLTMLELARVCKRGGYVIIVVPWNFFIHRFPVDCWRILPDGMRVLIEKVGKLECIAIDNNHEETYGVGRKR